MEVGRGRCEFVDQLVNRIAEASMLVSLEVRFQVILGKSFVDLEESSIPGRWQERDSSHLREWILFIGVFVSQLGRIRQSQKRP